MSATRVPDEMLMRLVDGELTEAERSELLRTLDHQSDGWRRCSLAFLEDQLLRSVLVSAGQPAVTATAGVSTGEQDGRGRVMPTDRPDDPCVFAQRPARPWWGRHSTWSLAATLVLAFCAGWQIQAQWGRGPAAPVTGSVARSTVGSLDSQEPSAVAVELHTAWEPFLVSSDRFWEGESAVPPSVRQALEQLGTRVDHERGFVPIVLSDGRHVVVPYEDVQLTPAARVAY